jgi:hypothetical protein
MPNIKKCPIPAGPYGQAGARTLMIGIRTMSYYNPTTKQVEVMSRPSITSGTNGAKKFRFGPSKLV